MSTARASSRSAGNWATVSAQGARRQADARPTCRAAPSRSPASAASAARDFTPIVNAPEVAILGVVRSKMAPVWNGESFLPRLMLPLCLSYDHRVIDGAAAARFTRHLATFSRTCAGSSSDGQERERDDELSDQASPTSATSRTSRSSRCTSSREQVIKAEDPLITLEPTRRRWTCRRQRPGPSARSRSRSATR